MKPTSIQAYSQAGELIPNHQSLILQALEEMESGTAEQIAEKTGLNYHAVARRLSELERKSLIHPSGIGKTKSNRNCTKYSIFKQDKEAA